MLEATTEGKAAPRASGLSLKLFGVMAATSLLTFATLTTVYSLFFTRNLFA